MIAWIAKLVSPPWKLTRATFRERITAACFHKFNERTRENILVQSITKNAGKEKERSSNEYFKNKLNHSMVVGGRLYGREKQRFNLYRRHRFFYWYVRLGRSSPCSKRSVTKFMFWYLLSLSITAREDIHAVLHVRRWNGSAFNPETTERIKRVNNVECSPYL